MDCDFRKKQPYSGFEEFEFDIPVAHNGDCYDRSLVRIEEIRQSLRIIEQCLHHMPAGPYKSAHRLTTPPRTDPTLTDIAKLNHHFVHTTWGPAIPAAEGFCAGAAP